MSRSVCIFYFFFGFRNMMAEFKGNSFFRCLPVSSFFAFPRFRTSHYHCYYFFNRTHSYYIYEHVTTTRYYRAVLLFSRHTLTVHTKPTFMCYMCNDDRLYLLDILRKHKYNKKTKIEYINKNISMTRYEYLMS